MEVRLCVKAGTDISQIEAKYGEMSEPFPRIGEDENLVDYYLGCDGEEDEDGVDWLRYDEAVAFCGFCHGAIPDSIPWIMGNGDWAQSMICVRDFSNYAMAPEDVAERLRVSEIYWEARRKGEAVEECAA